MQWLISGDNQNKNNIMKPPKIISQEYHNAIDEQMDLIFFRSIKKERGEDVRELDRQICALKSHCRQLDELLFKKIVEGEITFLELQLLNK